MRAVTTLNGARPFLHEQAQAVRDEMFGRHVFVREVVLPLVRELRRHTNLGITLCLGTLSPFEYDELREAGGDFFVIKIETGDPDHYQSIGAPGTLTKRVTAIRYLAETGWKVSSGFIVGLPGQTPAHVEQTLDLLAELPLV